MRESHANPSRKTTATDRSTVVPRRCTQTSMTKGPTKMRCERLLIVREIPKNLVGFPVPTAEPTLAFAGATNEQIADSRGSSRR